MDSSVSEDEISMILHEHALNRFESRRIPSVFDLQIRAREKLTPITKEDHCRMYLFQIVQKANEAIPKLSVSNSVVTLYECYTTTSIHNYRHIVFMNEDENE